MLVTYRRSVPSGAFTSAADGLLPLRSGARDVDRGERLGVDAAPAQGERAGADGASLDARDADEVHRVVGEPVAGVERRDLAQAVRRLVVDDRRLAALGVGVLSLQLRAG